MTNLLQVEIVSFVCRVTYLTRSKPNVLYSQWSVDHSTWARSFHNKVHVQSLAFRLKPTSLRIQPPTLLHMARITRLTS